VDEITVIISIAGSMTPPQLTKEGKISSGLQKTHSEPSLCFAESKTEDLWWQFVTIASISGTFTILAIILLRYKQLLA
jgi:hypothetical protein